MENFNWTAKFNLLDYFKDVCVDRVFDNIFSVWVENDTVKIIEAQQEMMYDTYKQLGYKNQIKQLEVAECNWENAVCFMAFVPGLRLYLEGFHGTLSTYQLSSIDIDNFLGGDHSNIAENIALEKAYRIIEESIDSRILDVIRGWNNRTWSILEGYSLFCGYDCMRRFVEALDIKPNFPLDLLETEIRNWYIKRIMGE